MFFHIDPHSEVPIYVQVINQIKYAVASGVLQSEDRLPSVRGLAKELVVNPNTIARAYQELERDNVIYTVKGRGTFVAESQSTLMYEERLKQLRRLVRRLLVESYHLNVDFSEISELLQAEMEKFIPGESGDLDGSN